MTEPAKQKPGFYGWKNVVLLFIIYMFTLGLVFYGFSVIFPNMIKTLGWNRGTASIAHTINALLMGFLAPLVAVSINKLGTKKTMSMGVAVLFIGLILLGTTVSQMWQWIIVWGFLVSFGFVFCGVVPIQATLMFWFNKKRATAIGIVMTGAALGGFLAQPFYTWAMALTKTWQIGWLIGAFFALIALALSFFLVSKPEDVGQHPDGLNPDEIKTLESGVERGTRTYQTSTPWGLKEAIRTPALWIITMVMIGYVMPLFLVTSHGVLHLTDRGFSQMQAASVLSFLIFGSGLVRFPVGWLGDRVEPRWIITIALGVMLIMFLGLWKISSFNLMVSAGIIFGMCYGSQIIMIPTIMANYYGPDAFAGINGMIGPILILFGASIPVGAGYVYEKTGNYDLVFIVLSIVLSIALVSSFFLSPPTKTVS
ncbi:MAG: MFS transporter [Deltaproteobacteria bacterium]|nr:MFS transporter [Deltaproteobacteria bacterium]